MVFVNTLVSGVDQGLLYAVLALGVYITYRLLDFADLTCEGSFSMGAMLSAVIIANNTNTDPTVSAIMPIVAAFTVIFAGAAAGLVTGILNTKFKIPPILSGILTLTMLTTINILIGTGRASVPVVGDNFASWLQLPAMYAVLISGLLIGAILIGVLYWFFGTEMGASIRATGANEKMARAQGINTSAKKIIALMISNALIALSGALVSQYMGTATVTLGTGSIVIGLAAVIIGETLIPSKRSFAVSLLSVIIGSVIYYIIYQFVILAGLPSDYIKLITAIIIVVALCLPMIKTFFIKFGKKADTYLRGKYAGYNAYAIKRDEKAAARKEEKKQKAIAEIKALQSALHEDTSLTPFKRKLTERRLARKKEKFEMKEGVKALAVFDIIDRETEEVQQSKSVEGGNGNA